VWPASLLLVSIGTKGAPKFIPFAILSSPVDLSISDVACWPITEVMQAASDVRSTPVCTENLIRVDDVVELLKLAE
jgi:hypothetical protein